VCFAQFAAQMGSFPVSEYIAQGNSSLGLIKFKHLTC
jgi:hypothetical protein